jgi:hypothetical protein
MVERVVVHNTAHGESLVPPQTRGRATLPAISSGSLCANRLIPGCPARYQLWRHVVKCAKVHHI